MIPRHRPPFGPWALFSQACRSIFQSADVDGLEQRYARQLGVAHAVWIPSARFGITAAIQQATEPKSDVVCPIFNCGAVFHAVSETGRRVRFADCAPNQFLLDTQADQNLRSGHAVVLSEMFGHRFSATMLRQPLIKQASLRVFDLAMGIPEAGDMERLSRDDVAVVSFGLGKSLYAGWGGMLLTHSKHMADAVRLQRRRFQQSLGLTESTKLSRSDFCTHDRARTPVLQMAASFEIRKSHCQHDGADSILCQFTRVAPACDRNAPDIGTSQPDADNRNDSVSKTAGVRVCPPITAKRDSGTAD